MIVAVNEENLADAGCVHALAWQESHRSYCSEAFVRKHTPAAQTEYLRQEMAAGKRVYMLIDGEAVGIVSVDGCVIGNLYVLPGRQRQGCGSRLLRYAIEQCEGVPSLWVMNINTGARRLYERFGFGYTGVEKPLKAGMAELEMKLDV